MTGLSVLSENCCNLSDNELINLYRDGDEFAFEVIINRYRALVISRTNAFFLAGADRDDIIQEGMIGLYKAVRDFKDGCSASFKTFANLCISRQIISAVKAATRQKHLPLNCYLPLDGGSAGSDLNSNTQLIDTIPNVGSMYDPEEILINRENYDGFECRLNKALSNLELKVLALYLEGKSYREISDLIGKDIKSVDNAVQRIKKKVEALVRSGDD